MSSKQASGASSESSDGFSAAEKAAMKERARELKAEVRANRKREEGEAAVRAKIAEMPAGDRALAERIHALVSAAAPELVPRTWYGMPAYTRDGKVVCFFQAGSKFESRYCTFGFQDAAALDEGGMWPTSFALTRLTKPDEATITALVKKAVR